jgi:hypothetical protein
MFRATTASGIPAKDAQKNACSTGIWSVNARMSRAALSGVA